MKKLMISVALLLGLFVGQAFSQQPRMRSIINQADGTIIALDATAGTLTLNEPDQMWRGPHMKPVTFATTSSTIYIDGGSGTISKSDPIAIALANKLSPSATVLFSVIRNGATSTPTVFVVIYGISVTPPVK